MLDALMQRDVALVVGGALLAGPANALTGWVGARVLGWWRARGAPANGNAASPPAEPEPEGSWLANMVGLGILGLMAMAVAPLVIVLVGGVIYFLWRLAWSLGVALWDTARGSETENSDEEGA